MFTTDHELAVPHDHVVQFYRHDAELVDRVAGYLAGAIESGGVAIAVEAEGEGDVDAFHEVCRQHSAVVGAPVTLPRLQAAPLELACTFRCGDHGPAEARGFVTGTLSAWGYPELVDDAAVIATELAANAVLHARTDFTVTISRRPDGAVRVAVRDSSLEPPRQRRPAPLDSSGRGLGLVAAMATGWGADLLPDGKVVWAQLAG